MNYRAPLAVLLLLASQVGNAAEVTADGGYLFAAAGCMTCHTAEGGKPLAGGRAFDTQYGTFYSPNISPDKQTGIGNWSREDFINAVKHGTAPDGSAYYPAFPYTSYRRMTDRDAGAIYDYLMQQPAQQQSNREHDLPWWLARWMMKLWQWWIMPDVEPPPTDPLLARGEYLVDALGHCGECHTPRNLLGVSRQSEYLAGTKDGPEGDTIPNITPDRNDGIGKWADDDLAYFFESGMLPDGDYVGGSMTEVVDNATSKLSNADRAAIVAYLKSIKPVPGP